MFNVNSFHPDLKVQPMRLLDIVEWAKLSEAWLNEQIGPKPPHGVLALPPLQRSAVWKPAQIVDLWDSVLRGLPIGSTYLVARGGEKVVARAFGSDASNQPPAGDGWDILDGQQRIRSLLLGVRGPCLEKGSRDKRCLWIELEDKSEEEHFRLRLTTESQPFGYQATNQNRLLSDDRREARKRIEPYDEKSQCINEKDVIKIGDGSRRAFDHELFEGFISGTLHIENLESRWRLGWPPLPYSAVRRGVYPLHYLLIAWLDGKSDGERKEKLRDAVSESDRSEAFIDELHKKFKLVNDATIAILKVELEDDGDLLRLFERIGAGGTPLTEEEKLFSTYKFYEPKIHDIVNEIYNNEIIGRALPPTKIANAAIRIANARTYTNPEDGNWVPGVDAFAKELSNSEIISGKKNRNIKEALTELLGPASQMADVEAKHITPKFLPAFEGLFKALALRPKPFDPGLPKVMMVTLSHRLLEVLLLWAITQSDIDPETIELQRADLLRFVMFWRLCVTHEDKASTQCFINIRINGDQLFPAAKLCDAILEFHEPIAIRLLAPDKLRKIVCRGEASDVWRTYPERFPDEPNPESVMARLWWKSGKDSLIWLQRDYLQNRFKEFDPASGRDDETPYDLDHMVPSSDWGRNWQTFKKAVRGVEIESFPSMQYSRSLLGCSIGNLRLIDYAENRSKSNAPFAKSALQPAPDSDSGATEVLNATEPHMQNEFVRKTPEEWEAYYPDMAFDPEQKELWRKASGDDEQLWTADRLTAFQQAVEERAAWLYEQFYSGLGFASWESKFLKDAPPAQ